MDMTGNYDVTALLIVLLLVAPNIVSVIRAAVDGE